MKIFCPSDSSSSPSSFTGIPVSATGKAVGVATGVICCSLSEFSPDTSVTAGWPWLFTSLLFFLFVNSVPIRISIPIIRTSNTIFLIFLDFPDFVIDSSLFLTCPFWIVILYV